MKKYLIFVIFSVFIFSDAYGFDIKGLQPVSPYGVFSAFSADSLPKRKFAYEIGAERSIDPDFYRYSFKSAFGLTDSFEFNFTVPYVYKLYDEVSGFEDISFGFKHRFFDEGKYGPSFAYAISASMASGEDEFSTDGRIGLGFILSKRVGPVTGHANIFYFKPGTAKFEDEMCFIAGFNFSAAHKFKILGELYGRKSHYSTKLDQLEGRFGYRFMTTDNIYTTIGVGADFKNRAPELRLFISISAILPVEKKIVREVYDDNNNGDR